jgi:fructose/tagatose bisphosphate aldolase
MSKNIVDSIIYFSNSNNIDIVFIPSRRQIEYSGGYVNNWTTKEFYTYIKQNSKRKMIIERDHGGPGQGYKDDDGFESITDDIKYLDIIHIDPWKKYKTYQEGLQWTLKCIKYIYSINPSIEYEIGTEEGIRPTTEEELDNLVKDIKNTLSENVFKQIKYLVIQCGTKLLEKENIGTFDSEKLKNMLNVAKKYNLTAKEHNGDWIDMNTVTAKESLGLECINIAPEFGEIETNVILDIIKNNIDDYELFFNVCLESDRWKKWVSESFIPTDNKEKLIKICGHYVFSDPRIQRMKNKYPDIDSSINKAILNRLYELHKIYEVRKNCIFCNTSIDTLLSEDKETPICYSLFDSIQNNIFIPYNIQYCKDCDILQTKYTGALDKIYSTNHIDTYGTVKHNMHSFFANFICSNSKITNTIEIGACHDYLSKLLLKLNNKLEVTIIDPSFIGDSTNINVISDYIENVSITSINANTIILSSVFEHFYSPIKILEILNISNNIDFIYINHPNMEYAIQNDVHINLTVEHTFYMNNNTMEVLFNKYGFILGKKEYFENHTICYEFIRSTNDINIPEYPNLSLSYYNNYMSRITKRISEINKILANKDNIYYLWPASMHTIPLFINGLDYKGIKGFVDNSPNKIDKYFYGYDLECFSFNDIISNPITNVKHTSLLLGGAENYRKELLLDKFIGSVIII